MKRYAASKEKMDIWYNLTPEQRDYDRYVGKIPHGVSRDYETAGAREAARQREEDREEQDECCSCHIDPPCSFCMNQIEEEINP